MTNIDASVKKAAELEAQIEKLSEELKNHRQAVIAFLQGTDATRYVTEDVEAILTLGKPSFDWDGLLSKLGEHLDKSDHTDMFPPSRTCRMCKGSGTEPAVINGNVAKRIRSYAPRNGIDFARIIDDHTTRGEPSLRIRRRS